MFEWKEDGHVPGLDRSHGKYDKQANAAFATLNAPKLLMLIVVGRPQGSGISVCGSSPEMTAQLPHVLRDSC
jgi:hypothetical protein